MIQTQQQSLSESEKDILGEWLIEPGAELFLKVIKSEQAFQQAESGMYYISIDRQYDEEKKNRVIEKAKFHADRSDELQFMIDKFDVMRSEEKPYEFQTTTLTP